MNIIRKTAAFALGLLVAASSGAPVPLSAAQNCIAIPVNAAEEEPLPAYFDLRREGLVSSIKDQSIYGTCWSHGAIACLESGLIGRDPDIDLSEWHLAYYGHCDTFGYPYDAADLFDGGATPIRAAGLLLSGIGPVYEKDCNYLDDSIRTSRKTMDEVRSEAAFRVTAANTYDRQNPNGIEEITLRERNDIKRAIMSGKAVTADYADSSACYNETYHSYFYDANVSGGLENDYGHVISIIGWDDNFPACNFNSDPGIDGAWLIKNSWGTNWGEHGCYWMSYAEIELADFISYEVAFAEPDVQVYQYDSYGNFDAFDVEPGGVTMAYAANVFTADSDSYLESVMLCNVMEGSRWDVTVYTGLSDPDDPTSGTAHAAAELTMTELGYQTVMLPEAVALHEGERFSVVARISSEYAGKLIPCEFAQKKELRKGEQSETLEESELPLEMLKQDFHAQESFYSLDGKTWNDIYTDGEDVMEFDDSEPGSVYRYTSQYGNFCIKAVTREKDAVIFSDYFSRVAPGTEIALSSHAGEEIYYAIDRGPFVLYEAPIKVDRAMRISAYVKAEEPVYYAQDYTLAEADVSSLLCEVNGTSQYAVRSTSDRHVFRFDAGEDVTTLGIMPISTGTVTLNGKELPSGIMNEIELTSPSQTLTLKVSQDGLPDAEYKLQVNMTGELNGAVGDVNLDGAVNASDAAQILIYAAEIGAGKTPELPDEDWLTRADYDMSGGVNASDAALVLIFAAEQGASQGVG